eukprot:gene30148-35126_t
MTMPMMRHQKMALAWMCKRETMSRPRGGILADDQGLGKTVSSIALILTHTPDHNPMADFAEDTITLEEDEVIMEVDEGDKLADFAEDTITIVDDDVMMEVDEGDKLADFAEDTITLEDDEFIMEVDDGDELSTAATATLGVGVNPIPTPPYPSTTATPAPATAPNPSSNVVCVTNSPAPGPKAGASSGVKRVRASMTLGASSSGRCAEDAAEDEADAGLLAGGTLVVCPTSVLHQWAREIREKVNPITTGFSVHVYHGKDKATLVGNLARYSVVLTTYGTLATDAPAKEKLQVIIKQQGSHKVMIKKQGSSKAPINLVDYDDEDEKAPSGSLKGGRGKGAQGGLLYGIKWHRVILDEAQSIKNPRTLAAHAAWSLSAIHRWCLSGTPIQNSVDDLYSYFKFLRYRPYSEAHSFKELLKDKIADNPEKGYKLLQAVLQSILLRRTKQTMIKGEPVVKLPPKDQEMVQKQFSLSILLRRTKQTMIKGEPVVKLPPRDQEMVQKQFSLGEMEFYGQLQAEGLAVLKENEGSNQYVSMLYQLLKLRQACNHPWLVKNLGFQRFNGKTGKPTAAEVTSAKKLPPGTRTQLVASLQEPQAMCPVCADVPESPVVTVCGHIYCKQCVSTQLEGTGSGEEFLCTTCSRVVRSNEVYSHAALETAAGGAPPALEPAPGDRPWVSSSKVDQLLELLNTIRSRNNGTVPGGSQGRSTVLAAKSKTDARLAGALRKLTPVPCKGSFARDGTRPEKVIVFSQWTGMLDLLEIPLKKLKYGFRRLDGTMTVPARENSIGDFEDKPDVMILLVSLKSISDFEDEPDVMILLVSLKAAALGVNLTVANHVVLMDLWWNPTIEEQAIDRAHRIGQTRTVHVTRICIKNSVEDRILELQERKRKVVASVLNEAGRGGSQGGNKLTMDDLRFLFGS